MDQSTESENLPGALAMSFPAGNETASCSKISRRLKKRLMETKEPLTAEEIENKLKEAHLRRQQFYELLSNKARPKQKGSSWSQVSKGGLDHQLEAKLKAAEQKRSSILAKAQMRLAKSDQLRQATKTAAKIRFEKQRNELEMKVKSRFQQAEANRMILLQAEEQRRAAKKERAAKMVMKKKTQERRYRERVHAAICYKRAAAEKRRLGLLEAEKKRARAMILQAQQVAMTATSQQDNERKKMRDQLDHRLERAINHRAEHLRKRSSMDNSIHINPKLLCEQEERLARKLIRCWRQFKNLRKTTYDLAKAYEALGINEESARSWPFEQLAIRLESATTTQAVKALCSRLENRLTILQAANSSLSRLANIDHLLKHVVSPNNKHSTRTEIVNGETKMGHSNEDRSQDSVRLPRYPARVFLCAYMIFGHPDEVLSRNGDRENALTESAANFIREFELLVKIIVNGSFQTPQLATVSGSSDRVTFRSQLEAFDKAWCSYLYQFVAWKVKDAKLLKKDFVKAARKLELSMMQQARRSSAKGETVLDEVLKNQRHVRPKVQAPSGTAGVEHLESPLSNGTPRNSESKECSKSSTASPVARVLSSHCSGSTETSSASGFNKRSDMDEAAEGSGHGVGTFSFQGPPLPNSVIGSFGPSEKRSDMDEAAEGSGHGVGTFSFQGLPLPNSVIGSFGPSEKTTDRLGSDGMLFSENELIVNEIVHTRSSGFADILGDEEQSGLKARVKETMEKAFWDGVIETLKEDDFSWVLKLVKEVRDELLEMSPKSWREEIIESIDIDSVSQVSSSGKLDIDFLGKILEYALGTLQRLSAPANDAELKAAHHKILKELAETCQAEDRTDSSFASLMIKGLRFVLEQIQTLKKEISKARMRMLEPLVKGPAGLEYLKKAFLNRYRNPVDAIVSLPLTRQWFSSVVSNMQNEWGEHIDSLSALTSNGSLSQGLPPITLRTGGTSSTALTPASTIAGDKLQECRGERVDLFVRLGLLKLVSQIVGLSPENLPETLKLNFSRLRNTQSLFQKIIVSATSVLVLRQILLSEKLVTTTVDMENVVSKCFRQLSQILENDKDVGIAEIIQTISGCLEGCDCIADQEKLQARKQVIANMLTKSLQAGDPVFEKVTCAVYLAVRGAVLSGGGIKGRQLAEAALRRVGALVLVDKVLEAAEVLTVVATVSCSIHGEWYEELLKSI